MSELAEWDGFYGIVGSAAGGLIGLQFIVIIPIAERPLLRAAEIVEPLLDARRRLRENFASLHRKLLAITRKDETCRRLMTIPSVGPVVSLAYVATIDIPARFRNSKAVGAALGLTPVLQSGESERVGQISLCGDGMMRTLLYEAGADPADA